MLNFYINILIIANISFRSLIVVYLCKKSMTQIVRTENINGGKITQEVVNRLSAQSIVVSPDEVKDFLFNNIGYTFDQYNSVVLFDIETKCIYGYILTRTLNIPNADLVFQSQTDIIEYLSKSNGLYISDIILREEIKDTPLINLLNTLHFTYCEGDCNKEGLYVWIDCGETVFASTKQENGFSAIGLNNISRAFYDKCLKKNETLKWFQEEEVKKE